MATFLNIPVDKVKEQIAKQLGKLEGVVRNKAKLALRTLIRKFKQRAIESATAAVVEKLSPSLCENTSTIAEGSQSINGLLQGVSGTLNKLKDTARKIIAPIVKLLKIVEVILNLPIPTSVPPGIGIPILIINKFEKISKTLKELVIKAKNLSETILQAVDSVGAANTALGLVLDRLNDLLAFADTFCELADIYNDYKLNGGGGSSANIGGINEDLLNEYGSILKEMADSLEQMLEGQDDGRLFDNATQEMLELIEDYEIGEFIPEGVKSRLRRRKIEDNFSTLNGDGANVENGDGLNLGPDGLPIDGGDGGALNLPDQNSEIYEAIDGNIYILKVENDPTSPEIALRRYGVAQTIEGVTVLKSPPTFTTKSKTILGDIKVRLDTQLSIL